MNLFNLRRPRSSHHLLEAESVPSVHDSRQSRACLMPSVERAAQVFVRGQGSWLWDSESRAYLDFYQGGAVNSLGHSPAVLIKAMADQAQALINPGSAFYNPGMLGLAERLCASTGSDQVHFLNTGAEANEGAIKLARKWGQLHRGGAHRVITATQSCHGRSFGAMSASGCGTFDNRFEPQLPGFINVPFNDLPALHAAVDAQTVAIMLEPVQSDAGVIPATGHYLKGVERLCRELGILLILDEVQTGMGRCGTLLAEQNYGVRADIVTLGKGLGGGVPLAALLARGKACCLEPGELGGTHHGNALMTAAGGAVLSRQYLLAAVLREYGRLPGVYDLHSAHYAPLFKLPPHHPGEGTDRGLAYICHLKRRRVQLIPRAHAGYYRHSRSLGPLNEYEL